MRPDLLARVLRHYRNCASARWLDGWFHPFLNRIFIHRRSARFDWRAVNNRARTNLAELAGKRDQQVPFGPKSPNRLLDDVENGRQL
jgi:hypothetical protein